MKKLEEIGICPNCDYSLFIYKTNNYKRFVKCDICDFSYPLPKAGSLSNSALICPRCDIPILIIEKKDQKAYFWVDKPCFDCVEYDKCELVKGLINEFTELKVCGY